MIDSIDLIVYGLATWRIASLFVNEVGPGHLFRKIRELCGIEHDADGNVTVIPDGFFPGVLSCVWCCSIWVGGGWMILDWILPVIVIKIASAFAFSALAIFLQNWLERGR